jgi:hypothetical protein
MPGMEFPKSELIAVFSAPGTYGIPPQLNREPASFMPMDPTDKNSGTSEVYAYHPTDDPNHVLLGVMEALNHCGISTAFMPGATFLKPGEVGLLVSPHQLGSVASP